MSTEQSLKCFIAGHWEECAGEQCNEIHCPNTMKHRTIIKDASPDQINRAVAAAKTANYSWWKIALKERHRLLSQVARELGAQSTDTNGTFWKDMLAADAAETGVTVRELNQVYGGFIHQAQTFLDEALGVLMSKSTDRRVGCYGYPIVCNPTPRSPAVILAPWNVPIGTIIPKLFVALLCGCSVILKPSEHAPTGISMMVRLFHNSGVFPDISILQLLIGGPATGKQLVESRHTRAIQFTGSPQVATEVLTSCSLTLKPLLAECGGSNCALVLDSAIVDHSVECIARGMLILNGQWCMGISRILVIESQYEMFLHKLVDYLNAHVVVIPSNETGTEEVLGHSGEMLQIGPVAFEPHARRLREIAASFGGHTVECGECKSHLRNSSPCFIPPTLVVDGDIRLTAEQEFFGPLAAVHKVQDVDEAITVANMAKGQLASYLFCSDVEQAYELAPRINSGMVMINSVNFVFEVESAQMEPANDFVACAGYGTDGNGDALVSFFTDLKWCGVNGLQNKVSPV